MPPSRRLQPGPTGVVGDYLEHQLASRGPKKKEEKDRVKAS